VAFSEAYNLSKSLTGQKRLKLRRYVDARAYKAIQAFTDKKKQKISEAAWAKLKMRT